MRRVYIEEQMDLMRFVGRASYHFADNPKHTSYTDEDVEPGGLLALRWGLDNDCVLVVKLDECFEPTIFANCIGEEYADADQAEAKSDEEEARRGAVQDTPDGVRR